MDNINEDVFHATPTLQNAEGVLSGIDPTRLNQLSRFGSAFYVATEPETSIAEVTNSQSVVGYGIRFTFNSGVANILDLTDPEIAAQFDYTGSENVTNATRQIGPQALDLGYDAIMFKFC